MNKNTKPFLRSGILLTAALAVICIFMPEWGVAQVLIVALVALLAAVQWLLFFYMKKQK